MDRYEIVRQLGEGGFGVVRLVREKATGEEWAAKYLKVTENASGQEDNMTRADIRNECEILKMMHHPSICRLREDFEIDGGSEVVMVLELLSGGDLLDSVIDNGTYSEADAREIFSQVLAGVAHIHEHGVVHRDLKVRTAVRRAREVSHETEQKRRNISNKMQRISAEVRTGAPLDVPTLVCFDSVSVRPRTHPVASSRRRLKT